MTGARRSCENLGLSGRTARCGGGLRDGSRGVVIHRIRKTFECPVEFRLHFRMEGRALKRCKQGSDVVKHAL